MKVRTSEGGTERRVLIGMVTDTRLLAKIAGKPLYQLLAERYGNGQANRKVFVYAAGGYYWPGKGLEGLTGEMQSYLDRGYSVVKMKIGGASLGEDCQRIEAVLKMLDEIGSVENVPAFMQGVKDKTHKLMGFGHRVYKNYDPRAKLMRETCHEVLNEIGRASCRERVSSPV